MTALPTVTTADPLNHNEVDRREYAELFSRYTRNSDGKYFTSIALDQVLPRRFRKTILDIGAGDFSFAGMLNASGSRVLAIEPNQWFSVSPYRFSASEWIHSRVQEISALPTADAAILSYVLPSIPSDQLHKLAELFSASSIRHAAVITAANSSPWACLHDRFMALIDKPRFFLETRDREKICSLPFDSVSEVRCTTRIFGYSEDDLFNNLRFFFYRYCEIPNKLTDEHRKIMRDYIEGWGSSCVYIEVEEIVAVYRIVH